MAAHSSTAAHSTSKMTAPSKMTVTTMPETLNPDACSAGKDQLGGQLQGTRTWIGTTECAALLRSFGVKAKIVDFEVGPDWLHWLGAAL